MERRTRCLAGSKCLHHTLEEDEVFGGKQFVGRGRKKKPPPPPESRIRRHDLQVCPPLLFAIELLPSNPQLMYVQSSVASYAHGSNCCHSSPLPPLFPRPPSSFYLIRLFLWSQILLRHTMASNSIPMIHPLNIILGDGASCHLDPMLVI